MVTVSILEPSDGALWDSFVAASENGTFYHLSDWQRVNREALGHRSYYLIARDGAEVRGVLPLTLVRSRVFGSILCSMPFVNFGGPCAKDAEAAEALLQEATRRAREVGADYAELRCTQPLATSLPVSQRKISMTLNLQADPDVLWNAFNSKHRTNIRRSYKNDLEVYSGGPELLPLFYSSMAQSWRTLGTPLYAPSYFEHIMKTFGDRTRIFVCHRKQEVVAVAFNGYFNGTVEGMWAGGSPLARQLQANYVLYWEMIKDACLRGCTRYHLGRSTAESGAEDFKRKWNASSQQLYWYFYRPDGGPMPELHTDNPKYRLAVALWQKMPLWATRMIGPRLARSIP